MMDQNSIIECGGFYFIHNFDSGNLGHVERVPTDRIALCQNHKLNGPEMPDYEFNMWTRPDCAGTEFENGNRTWFYFGIQAPEPGLLVRMNLINLNKQGKMYNQGMAPVTRTLPGKPQWERIRDRPLHSMDDNTFTLTFKYKTPENLKATTFFAFTYPFSFAELQIALNSIDLKMLPLPSPHSDDNIYYHRECLIYSLEGRRVDLLTISSFHGILNEREERLKNLFPDNKERAHKFANKKVIFISARVHPGETPSSFVFNGFLNLLLTKNDPIAAQLRKLYVFKMIPFLNPDGVARGHYRTDTRGVNLNRVYLNPSLIHHPTVYASRALIRYYHFGCEKEDTFDDSKSYASHSIANISESSEMTIDPKKKKGSASSPYRSDGTKRQSDKSVTSKIVGSNKSSTTIKASSSRNLRDSKAVSTSMVDQSETKLVEMPSQTSDISTKSSSPNLREGSDSLLNDSMLRSCLGSNVHLSTSEELNIPGSNPLGPLRDTLKNSISLLLESSSSVGGRKQTTSSYISENGESKINNAGQFAQHPENKACVIGTSDSSIGAKDSRAGHVRTGLCQVCRAAISRMEHSMPGIATMLPGYSEAVRSAISPPSSARGTNNQMTSPRSQRSNLQIGSEKGPRSPNFAQSIDEYREAQRLQLEQDQKRKLLESHKPPLPPRSKNEDVYFCTNCFKRYVLMEDEEVKMSNPISSTSIGVSCTESGDGKQVGSSMDATIGAIPAPKEDKTKSQSASRLIRKKTPTPLVPARKQPINVEPESGLYLYIDLHGHASKKGIFMYGNHFDDAESCVECMLLPRIMSLNNLHFHFSSCNFTERNMYLKDRRDGMSREGSGRVAVLKATGLVRSYTLECNYNTGRLVNVLPPPAKDAPPHAVPNSAPPPPKYTPHIFEEAKNRAKNLEVFEDLDPMKVGRSLGASILDLTGQHPNSRIPCSEHRNLTSVREWLRTRTKTMRPLLAMSRLRPNIQSPNRAPLYQRSCKKAPEERKENTFVCARAEIERSPALPAPRSPHDMVTTRFPKKTEPVKSTARTRYLTENEPKVKTIAAKRRNVLAIRKPNSKTQISGGVVKAKVSRRSIEEAESPRVLSAVSKRGFARGTGARRNRCRAMASSSSEEILGSTWEEVAGGTALSSSHDPLAAPKRRQYPPPAASHLKKIRLKTNM